MTDNVENLVLEQLRLVRGQNDKILDELRGIRVEITAMRHHVRGLEISQDAHHDDIASMKARLDRIERRLELVYAQS